MVCETVKLIAGVCIDIDKFLQKCKDSGSLDTYFDEVDDNVWELKDKIELWSNTVDVTLNSYTYSCCSKLKDKKALIGNIFKSYRRIYSNRFDPLTCPMCTSFLCEQCFNRTENGPYPLDKIFNTVYMIPPNEICPNCNGHSRILTPVPQSVCGTYGVYTAQPKLDTCSHCCTPLLSENIVKLPSWCEAVACDEFSECIDYIGDFAFIDDCTSCT